MKAKEMKHLVNFDNWTSQEVIEILTLSKEMKKYPENFQTKLKDKLLVMLFEKKTTRTRISFELGMQELGGKVIYLEWDKMNVEPSNVFYEISYISSYANVIMARMKKNDMLLEIKKGANVPVINGCCNMHHPCQAFADILSIIEDQDCKDISDLSHIHLCYIGLYNNVSNSLLYLANALNLRLSIVGPLQEKKNIDLQSWNSLKAKGLLKEGSDPQEFIGSADYIYTDTWIDMEFFNNPEYLKYQREQIKLMAPYQINEELLHSAKETTKVMHDMPMHIGYEISREVADKFLDFILGQARNRLHVQKAILYYLVSKNGS